MNARIFGVPAPPMATVPSIHMTDTGTDRSSLYNAEIRAQDFDLPRAVKSRMEAEVKQANAFAVTTALFAAGLLSLVQAIVSMQAKSTALQILRVITYCSVFINLSGTTLALILIKMCTDLETIARRLIITNTASWPARVARGETLGEDLLTSPYKLVEAFGMSRGYRRLDQGAAMWIIFGNLLTFISVILWVYVTEDIAVAGATMVGVVPALLGLTFAFYINRPSFCPPRWNF